MPLLTTFLKSYSRPFLGLLPPSPSKQLAPDAEPGSLSTNQAHGDGDGDGSHFPPLIKEEEELVETDIRDRFKRMCEGYFDKVCKKLVIEHKVRSLLICLIFYVAQSTFSQRLQDQDKRNHEAYIRSGEIFEDRQQAYEKMTKSYEKLLASCQS